MQTFKHSGTLGDLIYSLSIVKKLGGGKFLVAIDNLESTIAKYSRNPLAPETVDPVHKGRFTTQDYEWLRPLIERQPYIQGTGTWYPGDAEPDIDLDKFRSVLFRTLEGNYVQAYHQAFNLPFTMQDYDTPWLEADPIKTKPIVVSRTFRYRSTEPAATASHMQMAQDADLENNGIFVGTYAEHEDYVKATGVNIAYRPVKDFLELAGIVAGADMVVANQNFVYSLAMGLGVSTVLETIKIKPLQQNECFFPRKNCQYF
jgi:hypothetical protein